MNSDKSHLLQCYFEELENAQLRATELYSSNKFHLEGITILMCHIAAISKARYPQFKDWAAFKKLVEHYSGFYDIFENIDLLFFYQWSRSKLANDKEYSKLNNYQEIVLIFQTELGTEEQIKDCPIRYQKRGDLLNLLLSANLLNFDRDNFVEYIELFSNNQIFYEYARCEAVHNNDFPLINIGVTFPDMQRTYTHNHQVTGEIIKDSLIGIVANLKKECLANNKWPQEL